MILRTVCLLITVSLILPVPRTASAKPNPDDIPPGHQSVRAGNVPIAYTDQGEGEPLIILTPYRFSTAIWNDLAARLSSSMRVIVVEPPGLRAPKSMKGDFSDIRLLELYRDLVKALGLSQVHILGVGESGMEAAGFGHHWPNLTKSIISINGLEVAKWSDKVQAMLEALKQAGSGEEASLIPTLSLRWRDKTPAREEMDRLFVPLGDRKSQKAFEIRLAAYRDSLRSGFVPFMVENLNKPILLIRSQEDQFLTEDYYNRAQQIIPESVFQYEVVPDAGHFAFVDQPDKVAELIRAFVAKNVESQGY
ncbi:MAG: alpha/beta hydrolase [Nitrospirae bacterium]|nr:alpha/beta hydrolase [Nitrospirota bacterium]